MQVRAEELGVELDVAARRRDADLVFDPEAIHRAVLNVVTNAIDACDGRDPARVTVQHRGRSRGREGGGGGRGHGRRHRGRGPGAVFTLFVSKKGGRGTGLGLPVSQKILHEHGGQVSLKSTPGEGTTFRLELPLETKLTRPDQDEENAMQDEEMVGPDDPGETLVKIVDDSEEG